MRDRRALERLALGLPPVPEGRKKARTARLRRGAGLRRAGIRRQKRVEELGTGSEPIAIGHTIGRAPAETALGNQPLYLLIPSQKLLSSGEATESVLRIAQLLSERRPVLLVDLQFGNGLLRQAAGGRQEGLSEILAFGIAPRGLARRIQPGLQYLPAGTPFPDRSAVLSHPGWTAFIEGAVREGARVIAFAPPEPEVLNALAKHTTAAILLSDEGDEQELRGLLPLSLQVIGVYPPIPPEPYSESAGSEEAAPAEEIAVMARPSLEGGGELAEPLARNSATAAAESPSGGSTGRAVEEPRDRGSERAFSSALPRTSAGYERFIRIAAVPILAYWSYYIIWRWTSTLNWEAWWISLPLVLAESWAWVGAFLYVYTTWKLSDPEPPTVPRGLAADVFITAFDEPLDLVRRTAVAAAAITYPHRTYLLDDGHRDELRDFAKEIGIEYLTRSDRRGAKAGNLNHALQHTSGDLILQLDADHAPLPDILDQTLGFFADPQVAIVQTAQDFYNTDSFSSSSVRRSGRIWEEQQLFFSVIQPGKNRHNAAFFCGSGGVLRRTSLEEIGGFGCASVTEDIETSLALHSRGWRSIYLPRVLAFGLAANSAAAFQTQHRRWAQGAMQVLREYHPVTRRGLTLPQRLGYFYSLTVYFSGLKKLIFYLTPLLFFLTGVLPVRSLGPEFLIRFVPYLLLSILLIELFGRGYRRTWTAEKFEMAKSWVYAAALPVLLGRRALEFRVTPKGPSENPVRPYLPQLVLMITTLAAVYWGTFASQYGWTAYPDGGWDSSAFQLNFLWATLHFYFAAQVAWRSASHRNRRKDHRFAASLPAVIQRAEDFDSYTLLATCTELNAHTVRLSSTARFSTGERLRIALDLNAGQTCIDGIVIRARVHGKQAEICDAVVHLQDLPEPARQRIELHCTQVLAGFGVPREGFSRDPKGPKPTNVGIRGLARPLTERFRSNPAALPSS